jgi:hypothetical protein
MAEFFRRSPELLDFQDDLRIVLFELDLEVSGMCLDVRGASSQAAVGITSDRLTSSESDEEVRYAECRALAREVVAAGHVGIRYPSAAATWAGAGNSVLFGGHGASTWECRSHREVGAPRLTAADVSPLP